MSTTITEQAPIEVSIGRSPFDGALVVQIDTENNGGVIRVHLNDGNIFTGDPELVGSDTSMLDRIAAFTRETHKQFPHLIAEANAKYRDDIERFLVESGRKTR
jgi:hypothetical protein